MSGLSDKGFEIRTLSECLDEIVAGLLADVDSDLDTSSDQPIGQIAGVFAKPNAEVWELLDAAFSGWYDSNATGSMLDAVSAITGTRRVAQSKSVVKVNCALTSGTVLTTAAMVQVTGDPSRRWTLKTAFTAPSTGTHSLIFESEKYGPIEALAGTITTIVTPVTGWSSATNPTDAFKGNLTEGDTSLRKRRRDELRAQGASTLPALEAALNPTDVPGLISDVVLVNDTPYTDANGLPPHSFEAIVWDGATPAADDTTIRKIIWKHKPMGIQAFGSNVGTFVDEKNVTRTVPFSRPVKKRIVVAITVQRNPDIFPADGVTQIKEAITAYGASLSMGSKVVILRVESSAMAITGVLDVTSCLINVFLETSPASANIAIGPHEVATFDSSDITVTLV